MCANKEEAERGILKCTRYILVLNLLNKCRIESYLWLAQNKGR